MRSIPKQTHIHKTTLKALGPAFMAAALTVAGSVWAGESNPYLNPDGSWITISGSVESVQADRFTLDIGDGTVIVEMDDGDRVKVFGRIDASLFEGRQLQADTIIELSQS